MGVTSYDVIDTALGMMLRDSCDVLIESGERLASEVARLAREHESTPQIGRKLDGSMRAEHFRFQMLELVRRSSAKHPPAEARKANVAVGKVSGAVGIHAITSPIMESIVCEKLGLGVDPASTQIINRDRHAFFLTRSPAGSWVREDRDRA